MIRDRLLRARDLLSRRLEGGAEVETTKDAAFDFHHDGMPGLRSAVHAVDGWISAFPSESGVRAGFLPLFEDPRIADLIARVGPLDGKRILELGPLEGGHTYMLHQAGAHIDAIEANKAAFVRCLIAKETLELHRARFYLGDFMKWLEHGPERYDLVVASGVLYHMHNPLHLLRLLAAKRCDVYFWTHYTPIEPSDDVPWLTVRDGSLTARLLPLSYNGTQDAAGFCGGLRDRHCWMCRDDLLAALRYYGFVDVDIINDDTGHANGPALSLIARAT